MYNYKAHCFIFNGACLFIVNLTQGFYLGHLMNSTPNPHSNDLVIQALAAHRTGWLAGMWLLVIGATMEYCDLPEKWEKIMFRVMIYQAWHQCILNQWFTALGVVGGKMPMALTFNPKYDIAMILAVTYGPIVYFGCAVWVTGLYRKFSKMKSA